VLLKADQNPSEELALGDYKILVELARSWRASSAPGTGDGYGIIINSGPMSILFTGATSRFLSHLILLVLQ